MNYIDELLDQVRNEQKVNDLLPEKPNKASALMKCASEEGKGKEVHKYLRQNYPDETLKWVKDAKWVLKEISLSEIKMARRPGGAREQDKVKGIAEAVKDGKPMEPVVLVKTPSDDKYKIADGYHRTLGFEKAEKAKIKAWVGTVQEDKGPWDKEMHEKKLNVGKTAFEQVDFLEKESAVAQMIGNMGKSIATGALNAGKSLSGFNVAKSTKNKKNVLSNPDATKVDIKDAKKQQFKSIAGMAGSWGALGTASFGGAVADKYNDQRKQQMEQYQQFGQ